MRNFQKVDFKILQLKIVLKKIPRDSIYVQTPQMFKKIRNSPSSHVESNQTISQAEVIQYNVCNSNFHTFDNFFASLDLEKTFKARLKPQAVKAY